MAEYSIDSTHQDVQDPGFLFHPQSENWAEAFRAASAALEQPGDVSGPLLTTAGVHIIKYMGDEPGGAHVLTEEENAALGEFRARSRAAGKARIADAGMAIGL